MSFISRSDGIFKRLIDRYDLNILKREPLVIYSTVQPITDLDKLLIQVHVDQLASVIRTAVAGTGSMVCFEIPDGERWIIHAVDMGRSSGDGTLEHLHISKHPHTAQVRVATQTGASHLTTDLFVQPVILEQGDQVHVYVNTISTDTLWTVKVYYSMEDVF